MRYARLLSFALFIPILFSGAAHADRVAIIGGGASGLVTAWLLEQNHEVTLYEAQDHLGGHADSIPVKVDGTTVMVDTGAEFFYEQAYPHFLKLLRHFNVPLKSFSMVVTFYRTDRQDQIMLPPCHDGQIEWKSFQSDNLSRMLLMKVVLDNGHRLLQAHNTAVTLREFMDSLMLPSNFKDGFFYPFLAAQWGVSPADIQTYSAYDVLMYLVGNGDGGSVWYEIQGGMKNYIDTVSASFRQVNVKLNARVTRIDKNHGLYSVLDASGGRAEYDHIVFATDANVTSALLSHIPGEEALAALLGKVQYHLTKIAIHGDTRFMPSDRQDWRVINMRYNGVRAATTVYKQWKSKTPIFKSWITDDVRAQEDKGEALPGNLYGLFSFQHPTIDHHYFEAQEAVLPLQGVNNLWFAGMWTYNNDSHESAIISAMKVAERLAPASERLKILQLK